MGLTETASVAFANPLEASRRKYGSVGLPLGRRSARRRCRRRRARMRASTGEIELRGENVMAAYYRAPELTAQVRSADGWLATGDLGYRDGDGYYFVVGRRKELIIKGGENIAPREIDEALLRHPAVLEAAAVGIPDPDYGQDILACVVLKPGDALRRGGTARALPGAARALQGAAPAAPRRRAAQGPFGQGAAVEAARSAVSSGLPTDGSAPRSCRIEPHRATPRPRPRRPPPA